MVIHSSCHQNWHFNNLVIKLRSTVQVCSIIQGLRALSIFISRIILRLPGHVFDQGVASHDSVFLFFWFYITIVQFLSFGELRLSRLNKIFAFRYGNVLRGYQFPYQTYS